MPTQFDRWIMEEVIGTTWDENHGLVPDYSSDMRFAIEVLDKLDELSRSWNNTALTDKFKHWECEKNFKPYVSSYSFGKFAHGDYPGLPTFWGVLETRFPFKEGEEESSVWLSEHKSPAMSICLAALFLKTGRKTY